MEKRGDGIIRRVISAIFGAPLFLLFIYLGGVPLVLALVALGALGCIELSVMMVKRDVRMMTPLVAGGGAAVLALLQFLGTATGALGLYVLVLAGFSLQVLRSGSYSIMDALVSTAAMIYLYGGLGTMLVLRSQQHGLFALMAVVLGTWVCDTLAYLFGTRFGKHRMCPSISPGKTWEGAAAGFLGGTAAVTALLSVWLGVPVLLALLAGSVINFSAQVGDLFESSIKRYARVKDSGRLIPGHGGILDRMDSLLFAVPVALILLGVMGY